MRLALLLLIFTAPASATCLDIPAGTLAETLNDLAAATHTQVLFDMSAVRPYYRNPIRGCMSRTQALQQLLDGTGLTYAIDDELAIITLLEPCQPELGKDAPLPPCLPATLKVRASL